MLVFLALAKPLASLLTWKSDLNILLVQKQGLPVVSLQQ